MLVTWHSAFLTTDVQNQKGSQFSHSYSPTADNIIPHSRVGDPQTLCRMPDLKRNAFHQRR